MKILKIKYKINFASEREIYIHLKKCDNDFIPVLSVKVNLGEYSKKIFDNAVRFEAWLDGKLIGLVAIYLNDENNNTGYITNVSVLKEYTGFGIATKLLTNSINYANKMKYKKILLEVNKYNTSAIILYNKLKFTKLNVNGDSVVMKLKPYNLMLNEKTC